MNKFIRILAAGLAAAAPLAVFASPLADLTEVEAAIERGAIVWDVRPADEYRRGHLPGAVNIGDPTKVLREPGREDFVPTYRIEAILGAAGIDPAQEVVVYGRRGAHAAYFGRFALRYFGGNRVAVYHDGIDGWRQAGRRLDAGGARRTPTALRLHPRPELIVTTDEIVAATKAGADLQLVDVRTRAEHSGEDVRAIRGGHIPGSINIPYELNWRDHEAARKLARGEVPDNGGMALNDRAALEDLYSALDPFKETIVYCQSGTRSAVTATILEALGFPRVKIYDASWLGYAARLDAPVDNESFVNVGALQARLRALAGRLDRFEREARAPVAEQP